MKMQLVKEIGQKKYKGKRIVALNFGIDVLFATDKRDLMGREFYRKIEEYVMRIDKFERNLMRQRIKPTRSKKYRKLQNRLKAYMKNEIRRIINRVVELYRPKTIVVENLKEFLREIINKFSKNVKRILMRFGLGEIRGKLKELEEEYGIEVVEINPAYSFQSCSSCGYVDKGNRKRREEIECRVCGKKLHVDVNGSLNLKERFLEGWSRLRCGKEQAIRRQVQNFLNNLFSERFKRLGSKARGLLAQNPYFLRILSDSPKPEAWTIVHSNDISPC